MAESVIAVVTIEIGEHVLAHAFFLQAQCHYGICSLQSGIEIPAERERTALRHRILPLTRWWSIEKMSERLRHQTGGTAKHHIRATSGERPEIGTRDAGVEYITHDHDATSPQGLGQRIVRIEVMSECVEVQQTLAGVAVQTITGIEHHRAFTGAL